MIEIFKDIKKQYYLVAIGGALLMGLVLPMLNLPFISVILAALTWALICSFYFYRKANLRSMEISRSREECKVRTYVETYRNLLKDQKPGSTAEAVVKMNLAAGLMDIGETDEAMKLMSEANLNSGGKKVSGALTALYHSNSCFAYIKELKFDKARESLKAYADLVESLGLGSMDIRTGSNPSEDGRNTIARNLKVRGAQIVIAECDKSKLDWAEDIMLDYFNTTKNNLEKTAGAYWLARLCFTKGEREEERRYLEFAAENGGDTFYGTEARIILEEYRRGI